MINTHDMNSVMGIGDNIVLLKDGHLVWQGDKTQVLESNEDVLKDFIFASPFPAQASGGCVEAAAC